MYMEVVIWLLLMLLIFCLQKQRNVGRSSSRMVCKFSSWWLPAPWNWTHETSVFLFVCCLQIAVKLPAKMGVSLPSFPLTNVWSMKKRAACLTQQICSAGLYYLIETNNSSMAPKMSDQYKSVWQDIFFYFFYLKGFVFSCNALC